MTDYQLPEGAIGFKKDLTKEQLVGMHIDSLTGAVFPTEEAYLAHVSPVTGTTPVNPEHHGLEFMQVQKAALERPLNRDEKPEQFDEAKQQAAIEQMNETIAVVSEAAPEPDQTPVVETEAGAEPFPVV